MSFTGNVTRSIIPFASHQGGLPEFTPPITVQKTAHTYAEVDAERKTKPLFSSTPQLKELNDVEIIAKLDAALRCDRRFGAQTASLIACDCLRSPSNFSLAIDYLMTMAQQEFETRIALFSHPVLIRVLLEMKQHLCKQGVIDPRICHLVLLAHSASPNHHYETLFLVYYRHIDHSTLTKDHLITWSRAPAFFNFSGLIYHKLSSQQLAIILSILFMRADEKTTLHLEKLLPFVRHLPPDFYAFLEVLCGKRNQCAFIPMLQRGLQQVFYHPWIYIALRSGSIMTDTSALSTEMIWNYYVIPSWGTRIAVQLLLRRQDLLLAFVEELEIQEANPFPLIGQLYQDAQTFSFPKQIFEKIMQMWPLECTKEDLHNLVKLLQNHPDFHLPTEVYTAIRTVLPFFPKTKEMASLILQLELAHID